MGVMSLKGPNTSPHANERKGKILERGVAYPSVLKRLPEKGTWQDQGDRWGRDNKRGAKPRGGANTEELGGGMSLEVENVIGGKDQGE